MRAITKVEYTGTDTVTLHTSRSKMIVACDHKKMQAAVGKYQAGELIQEAFYFLSSDVREFMLSGITPEKWKEMFG